MYICRKICALLLIVIMLVSAACAEEIIPFGEELTFETQITADGKARLNGEELYETVAFTLKVTGNRGPVHFKKHYEEAFALNGKEAVAEIELVLHAERELNPNQTFLITLRAENGDAAKGYQLMDWEIGGDTTFAVPGENKVRIFKRYDFDEDDANPMRYLVIHSFNDGVEQTYLMDMRDPDGESSFYVVYEELRRKSRGKAVKELQTRLSELGLLKGSSIDGVYGPATAESVKSAQKLLGFEETGIADHDFQKALYKYQIEE